jgi:hypothetical protein
MLTTALSVLVILLFVAWMIVSALNQHPRTRRFVLYLVNRDIFSLIPIWTFFAPNPGCTDLHLLYRDRDAEGGTTDWREIVVSGRDSWLDLWNPHRRISKGVTDVGPDLTHGTDYVPRNSVDKKKVLGFPYLLLLNYVCSQPADFRAEMRQFALARTGGFGTEGSPEVVFLSAFHRIAPIA